MTLAPSHRPPDVRVQTHLCANTSSLSGSYSVTIEHTVATIGYTQDTEDKESLEHPSTEEKDPADKADFNDEVLDKSNCDNLENCLALSRLFQKPSYQVLISVFNSA